MKILKLNAQNYRNIALASVDFGGSNHFLLGKNGQGKTNLLEAINFITALRSFRTQENANLIKHGEREATLYLEVDHELEGEISIVINIAKGRKDITVNGVKVNKLSEFIGRFPTIALCAEDIHILRGSPSLRRRFIDVTLSATNKSYFIALQKYHKALQQRNSLLKDGNPDPAMLNSFEHFLAEPACYLNECRRKAFIDISNQLNQAYKTISPDEDHAEIKYKPNCKFTTEEDFKEILLKNRDRDRILKSTQSGLHRDDFEFILSEQNAKDYASEGQQRSLVLSLRIAQLKAFQSASGIAPVVLADDILGQLDPERRTRFWNAINQDLQIIATGTSSLMDNEPWIISHVEDGKYSRETVQS